MKLTNQYWDYRYKQHQTGWDIGYISAPLKEAGKDAAWTVKQLKDFQSGARKDATMNAMAPMAAGHEQAIADYLAGQ